jgi:nifR3 family TIM-barrel protein
MKFPKLNGKAVLSPMAGVTDVAFRALAKKYGAAVTYTEFVSGTAIVRGNATARRMLAIDPIEKPVAVQLFGNNEDDVVAAAQELQETFDIIDINCGCPAWKVIKTGAGSELLKHPDKISHFVNRLATAVKKPVTVKIRTGIDDKRINAVEVAKVIENAGAAAIAIHGRTQKQGYSGTANWDIIKQVKEAVNIPVIGNGDVFTPEQFKQRIDQSGVDAIMIARGAMGNPFVFAQINEYLKNGSYSQPNTIELFFEYLELARRHRIGFAAIKNHAIQFTKGIRGGNTLREQLSKCTTTEQIENVLAPKRR